ncbi:hypothetical protein OHS70_23370 [Streptomyces sp. NBC_00390]|uniref:hypothetical protein n=1 Tax=Streptomyces sp. NBC_00390 TaxID=2975736 RepID=UPI002E1B12A7
MNSSRKLVASVAMSVAFVLGVPFSAYAGHDDDGFDPDNRSQAVKGFSLTSNGTTAMNHGKAQLEKSVITTSWGDGDIRVYDANYGDNGWHGSTDCVDWNAFMTSCDVMRVRFNQYQYKSYSEWKSLGCHEFGHTGDLGHRSKSNDTDNNSCMRSDRWPQYFDQHDLNAIAAGT